jgi:uncharacterized protein YqeY
MSIQERVQADFETAKTNRDVKKRDVLKIAIAEFSRENPKKLLPGQDMKKLSDERVVEILKSLIDGDKKTAELAKIQEVSPFVLILEEYLPEEVTVEPASGDEIKEWIKANLDLATFKNRLQAMRPLSEAFRGRADGDRLKEILLSL